ncbi:hydroxyneurosporene-O-methyltransferase [Mycobacterium triplex]|uniref:Hydroxyneurosporene-O-methyltransferase n=1 Tax=Mycobacterium triplex TaxID=47839 RepID=A0A024K1B1_9MYCO|nr:hydroxyneurosporene-O-methyltransferase [Mycobacterium triplex]
MVLVERVSGALAGRELGRATRLANVSERGSHLTSKVPPTKVVRAVELARQHLARLRQRFAPPPAVMLELILNAWVAQAITTAADLGVADALAAGPLSGEQLADRVGADADALRRLLRALIGIGIFRRRGDGRYALTPLAAALRTDAPVSMAGMARWVGSPQHREHWSHLTDAVRTGNPVLPELRGKPAFEYLIDEAELGAIFNSAMTNISEFATVPLTAACDFSAFGTIVDVGGGHGRLLAAILQTAPNSRGVLFDLPEVVADAGELFRKHGVDDRVRIEEGSFFESAPAGGDAYVLKNIIHDWPEQDAIRILANVRAAARTGARILLCEFVIPDHDRDFHGKWVDLEMLVVAGARERTVDEYGELFDRAGFRLNRVVDTVSPLSIIEATAV